MDIITCIISPLFELSFVLQVIGVLSYIVVKVSHNIAHVIKAAAVLSWMSRINEQYWFKWCWSSTCPKSYSETYPVIFNFQPLPHKLFLVQIKSQFLPDTVELNYYVPDNNIPHILNSKEDIISKQSIKYYECWGASIIQKANLVSGSSWLSIIPFCISSFKSDYMKVLIELLPTLHDKK